MKTIYRSEKGKKEILDLYDAQLARLGRPYKDIYVETSFGKTHLIETGNPQGEPLLVFHGGNATTAYNLLACDFCLRISIFWQLILSGTQEKVLRRIAFFRVPESLRERRRSFRIAQHTFFAAGDICIS